VSAGSRQTRRQRRARRWRRELKKDADTALFSIIARTYVAARGVDWSVLFFAMLASLVGSVVCVLTGGFVLGVLLFVSSLFLCAALWAREFD